MEKTRGVIKTLDTLRVGKPITEEQYTAVFMLKGFAEVMYEKATGKDGKKLREVL